MEEFGNCSLDMPLQCEAFKRNSVLNEEVDDSGGKTAPVHFRTRRTKLLKEEAILKITGLWSEEKSAKASVWTKLKRSWLREK